MADSTYDVIVIGAGAVGENAADATTRAGLHTAIVESELVGGECSYWACMPSKTLLRPGKALDAARRAPGAGGAVTGDLDVDAALERRNVMVSGWDDSGQVEWLEGAGISLIRGHARLTGERSVSVTSPNGDVTRYRAGKAVVVATGSTSAQPDIHGLAETAVWDSRAITSARDVPNRLLFIGGGTVGVEMAQAWSWLGAEATVLQLGDHLLAPEEPFAGAELAESLERQGVRVLTNADTKRLTRNDDGSVTATVEINQSHSIELEADEVVVATGRRPRTTDLGLETVGVEPGQYLRVNHHMQVEGIDGGWLYSVGDANGRALFTHMGKYQARIAGSHIGGAAAAVSPIPAVPRVVFTSPEIAAVGLTEKEAVETGLAVDTVTHDIGQVAGASTLGRGYSGTAKLVIDRRRQVVVGATFVGPSTGELIHAATVAIIGEVPLARLWHAVPSFPTLSEVWLRLLERHRDGGWDPYAAPIDWSRS